ncbi:hypothetical protein JCGZ_12290 [Jatropha curcas]|uniref:Uncharacterized protein n=1 Tax=Jatropha curcas TaxID=180498 RepID=A0A067KJ22_JATCU|nr:hypothetical protein JCGZ_12290 [Jatropha curcas]
MGACASSQSEIRSRSPSSSTIKIIDNDGKLQELKQPIKAGDITAKNPDSFLCSSESMYLGMCIPHVPEEEELQLDQIYFLLPQCQAHKPLSLPHLCSLAVKASSALGLASFPVSESHGYVRVSLFPVENLWPWKCRN